jgi:hypothetical protein
MVVATAQIHVDTDKIVQVWCFRNYRKKERKGKKRKEKKRK